MNEFDINEVESISSNLKVLTSLLFVLADAEDGGFVVDSESLNHLRQLAVDCKNRLDVIFRERA